MADPTSVDIAVRDSDLNPTSIEAQRAHLMARHLAKKRDLDDMMQQMMDQGCQGISDTDLIAELDKQMKEYQAKRSSEKEGTEKREHWIEGYTGGIFDMDPEDIVYLVIHPKTVFDLKILFDLTPFPTTDSPPLPFLNSLMDDLVEGKLSADEIECFVKCFIAMADLGPKCQKVHLDNIAKLESGHHNRGMAVSRRHIMLGEQWRGVTMRALMRFNAAIEEEKEYMKKQVDEHMMLHYMMAGGMTDEIKRLAQQDYLADRLLAVELGEDDEALKDHVQAHEQREEAIKARWREQAALQQGEEE